MLPSALQFVHVFGWETFLFIFESEMSINNYSHEPVDKQPQTFKVRSYLKDSMLRTLGAGGIFINKELAKKVMRRRASKFIGTLIADSFTVKSK